MQHATSLMRPAARLQAQLAHGEKTIYKPVNPKAVTRNELYGCGWQLAVGPMLVHRPLSLTAPAPCP